MPIISFKFFLEKNLCKILSFLKLFILESKLSRYLETYICPSSKFIDLSEAIKQSDFSSFIAKSLTALLSSKIIFFQVEVF